MDKFSKIVYWAININAFVAILLPPAILSQIDAPYYLNIISGLLYFVASLCINLKFHIKNADRERLYDGYKFLLSRKYRNIFVATNEKYKDLSESDLKDKRNSLIDECQEKSMNKVDLQKYRAEIQGLSVALDYRDKFEGINISFCRWAFLLYLISFVLVCLTFKYGIFSHTLEY